MTSDHNVLPVSGSLRDILPQYGGGWRTRFAPAPTGWLHLGHAVNAVFVWGIARAFDGRVLLRVEDHDRGRCRSEFEHAMLDDLDWLGLEPDIGSTGELRMGAHEQRQSDRGPAYHAALAQFASRDAQLVYPCVCSRRDMAALATDAFGEETRYSGTCRLAAINPSVTPARRVRVEPGIETFDDLACGTQAQDPSLQCGDVLVRDRAGHWTYQFAVVVDDMAQQIDVVIRGRDLLQSTGRQLRLARLLGRRVPPRYLHHALVMKPDGAKLSKSDGATGLRELRAAGWSPERVLGEAARLGGVQHTSRSLRATDLADLFAPR